MPLFVLADGSQLVRSGECNRCGECCRDAGRDTEPETGLKQEVPGYCVYFRWAAPGLGECTGRASERYLRMCAPYPPTPVSIPSCSYEWQHA